MKTFTQFISESKKQRVKALSKILRRRLRIKPGVKTSGLKNYFHSTPDPDDVSTEINTFKSPAHFAMANSPKTKLEKGKRKVVPNSERAFRAKQLLKSITPHRNSKRPTHSIDLPPNLDRDYGDRENIRTRTQNLKNAAAEAPKHLRDAGAKKGDIIVIRPGQTQSGGPKEAGRRSRSRLYSKLFPKMSKLSSTGVATHTVDESSSPERGRRLLGPRGPSKYDMDRLYQRTIDSDRAALRKAGFKRNPSKSDVDFYADNSHHHSTSVMTHPNQSSYAITKTKNKNLGTGLRPRGKVNSTASRVRELKSLRRQLGSDRTSRKVHDVEINSMHPHKKNDPEDLFKRHRSFRQSLYDLPKTLRAAGAKPGDKITGEPAETMFGSKDLKSGKEKRAKLYDKILGKKMNSKTGIIVGTYGESTELDEKYYKPSSKLPSGKTPLQKAIEKREQRQKNISPNSNIKRAQKHSKLTDTKVMRGADNKNYDDEPHPDVDIDSDNDNYLTVHHPKSGIEYHVHKLPKKVRGKRDVHSIEWIHGRMGSRMSPSERVRIGKAAHDVWKHHVVHRIPHGSILHNSPIFDTKSNTQEKRNKRGDIYKRAGFGDVDSKRDQFASLNRPPSPRQKAKGKLQLSPLDANKTKKQLGWDS